MIPVQGLVVNATQAPFDAPVTVADYVLALERAQDTIQRQATDWLHKELRRREQQRPAETSLHFAVGTLVKVKGPDRPANKLRLPFVGPYAVLKRAGDVYTLQDVGTMRTIQRHLTHLRAFHPERTPNLPLLAARARDASYSIACDRILRTGNSSTGCAG